MDTRATIHNGRCNTAGRAFTPKHNDRNFNTEHAPHIDPERSANNRYWHWLQNEHPEMTFEDAEKQFYNQCLQQHLDAVNARYIKNRHPERVKSIDDYRKSAASCPEETILMIGNQDDAIPKNTMWAACTDLINWEKSQFPNVKILDVALHADESGGIHLHERKAWIYTDQDGHTAIGQNKALQAMGIERPDPQKPQSRYNNAKQTYSQMLREKFVEICRGYGLDIIQEPKEKSRSGLTLAEYKAQQEVERTEMAMRAREALQRDSERLQREIAGDELDRDFADLWSGIEQQYAREELERLYKQAEEQKAQLDIQKSKLEETQRRVQQTIKEQRDACKTLKAYKQQGEREQRHLEAIRNKADMAQVKFNDYNKRFETQKGKYEEQFQKAINDLQELQGYLSTADRNRAYEIARHDRWQDEEYER